MNSGKSYVGHSYIRETIYPDDRIIYKSSLGSDPIVPLSPSFKMYGYMGCVYKVSGQITLCTYFYIYTHTEIIKYFLSHIHYFNFIAEISMFAVLDPLISGSGCNSRVHLVWYSILYYSLCTAAYYDMITITIRLTDIWKKSNIVTYFSKFFLETDYQTVHEWLQNRASGNKEQRSQSRKKAEYLEETLKICIW